MPEQSNSFASTMIITCSLLIAAGGMLLFAYAIFGPALLVFFIIGIVLATLASLHWFLWGRSMPRDDDAEQ